MTNCEICGTDLSVYFEFGGSPEMSFYTADGDGLTCSKACKEKYARRLADGMCEEFGHAPNCEHNRERRQSATTPVPAPRGGWFSGWF